MVLPEVARFFDLKDQLGSPASDTLLEYVREKRLLLVLDNFEQVLDAAPAVVRLLEASPWTKVLATSREALHVRGERKLVVGPLGLPGAASSGRVGAGVSPA